MAGVLLDVTIFGVFHRGASQVVLPQSQSQSQHHFQIHFERYDVGAILVDMLVTR